MIDLHVHILPGVDDGSPDMEESLEMARMAAESGVSVLAATPHSNQEGRFENYADEELKERFRKLKNAVMEEEIPLKIVTGMEIFASEDLKQKIEDGRLMGINGTGYYLVEFGFGEEPWWMEQCLQDIRLAGKIPLLAHPERYYCVQDEPGLIYDWIKLGCVPQINKGSVLGRFGREPWETAGVLLKNGLAACVASDAHSPYFRTTHMGEVCERLFHDFGFDYTNKLLRDNPGRILKGKAVPLHGRRPDPESDYFWQM